MALPQSEINRLKKIANLLGTTNFMLRDDIRYVIQIAKIDPTAVSAIVDMATGGLRSGSIQASWLSSLLLLLRELANTSEYLRDKISQQISSESLDFYVSDYVDGVISKAAQGLLETLNLERPKHYFDLCRQILTCNGSIFVIGAGFSFNSYAPLLREMEGIACSTLYDLGVKEPRNLYYEDERKAWQIISSKGWQIFQNHMSFTLLPKQPSDQHFILAELFYAGHISHIVSLNWDDLVEKAYQTLYKETIPLINKEDQTSEHALWKLHGDVANPDERWILPFEEGRVFRALEKLALQISLPGVVIGYREQEKVVREKLLNTLEKRGGVSRIRPDLPNNPPESFADDALKAMKTIKASLESAKKSVYPA
ncbi:MAG: SIR2 family protein [Chloroflexota bacterium]